jgi:phosphotransferase family enzyme
VIRDVVSELGAGWTYERHLRGGAAGAALVRRPDGSPAVLRVCGGTLSQQQERVSHIRSLRAVGYPTPHEDAPRQVASGALACVTDFVSEAEPVAALTDGLVDELCGLLDLQAGLAPNATGWGSWLAQSLTEGFGDWCRPAALRSDPRCAALADRAGAHAHAAAALNDACDLIHSDFHQGNVLTTEGRLKAVIDCGGVRTGDRWFDLVTALTIAAVGPDEVRRRLRGVVEQHVPARALTVYVAHHGVRLLDWALTWAPDQVDFWVGMTAAEFDRYGV